MIWGLVWAKRDRAEAKEFFFPFALPIHVYLPYISFRKEDTRC